MRLQALSITDEKINKINSYLKNDIKDEDLKKLTENNARGPKSIQSSDIAARSVLFSSDLLTSTSGSYKESSLTNIKSSAMDLVNSTNNSTLNSSSSDSKTTDRKDENISLYKPYAFPLTTSNSSTPYSSAHLNSLLRNSNNSKTTTATTIASSTVPSTSTTYETKGYTLGSYQFPSTTKSPTTATSSLSSASSSAISSSGLTTATSTTSTSIATTTAFSTSSNKYEDSPVSSSVTTAYSSTLSKLSSATSSPSRTIINTNNNTNTLPLNIGRNNTLLYQSESNYNTTTNTTTTNTTTTSYTSPVVCSAITSTSNGSSYLSQGQSSYSNIYGTLPKTSSNSYSSKYDLGDGNDNGSNGASKYSTNTYSSYKYNSDFSTNNYSSSASTAPSVISNTNGSGSGAGAGNTNSLFRVQYSSTNPFLDAFDAPSAIAANDANESASDNITALLRGNSSGISTSAHINRFEKLDSEEDLK